VSAPGSSRGDPFPADGGIFFVIHSENPIRVEPGVLYTSPLASNRLRVFIPAAVLAHRAPVWLLPLEQFLEDPSCTKFGRPGAVVISKFALGELVQHRARFERLLATLERGGPSCRIVADLSDDLSAFAELLQEPFLSEFQQRLSRVCPLVVPCEALALAVRDYASQGVTVIEDPYESLAPGAPRAPGCRPLRLLWFGNFGEVLRPFVEEKLVEMLRACHGMEVELEFIAGENCRSSTGKLRRALTRAMPSLRFSFTPWSLQAVDHGLARCDLVLLPQDLSSPAGRVKSHNRIVAAIRAGRLAVASPIPSYRELEQFACVDDDLAGATDWALRHPDTVMQRLTLGQREIERRFSPQAIARKWAGVLGIDVSDSAMPS
jgi:glycosyltransferase involved in cell wall biosynthesis